MNNTKNLALFLLFTVIAFGCKKDEDVVIEEKFTAEISGTSYVATTINYQAVFDIYSIIASDGTTEISLQLNGNDEGTYEVGGADKSFTVSYDLFSTDSGTVTITEKNTDDKTLKGTFNFVLTSGLPGVPDAVVTNGEFLVEY